MCCNPPKPDNHSEVHCCRANLMAGTQSNWPPSGRAGELVIAAFVGVRLPVTGAGIVIIVWISSGKQAPWADSTICEQASAWCALLVDEVLPAAVAATPTALCNASAAGAAQQMRHGAICCMLPHCLYGQVLLGEAAVSWRCKLQVLLTLRILNTAWTTGITSAKYAAISSWLEAMPTHSTWPQPQLLSTSVC